jgi:YD repeat-containing protein
MRFIFFLFLLLISHPSQVSSEQNFSIYPFHPPSIFGVNVITGEIKKTNSPDIHYDLYQEGENRLGEETLYLSADDFRIGKVKTIDLNLSEYPSIHIYLFFERDATRVCDQTDRVRIFRYTPSQFLQAVEDYQRESSGSLKLYRIRRLFWIESPSPRLISHSLEDENGEIVSCYSYFYNDQGELVKEVFSGNLSGNCSILCKIGKDGYPEANGVETYSIDFHPHSQEEHDFLSSMFENNSLIPTDLTVATQDQIFKGESDRQERYDEWGQCVAAIDADGNETLYTYDSFGRLISILSLSLLDEWDQPYRSLTTFAYNICDQITQITDPKGEQITISYNARGKPIKIVYPDGSYDTFTYFLNGALKEKRMRDGIVYSVTQDELNNIFCMNHDDGLLDLSEETSHTEDESRHTYSYAIWNGAVDAIYSFFNYLQTSVYAAKVKWTPELKLPLSVSQAFENISKTFFSESIFRLMGSEIDQRFIEYYGEREISDKVRVTFINGIMNSAHILFQSLKLISESHGGIKVHYVYRPTDGWTLDLARAVLIKTAFLLGFRSAQAHLLAQMWRQLIQEMGGVGGGGTIIHYAHSIGGSDTDRARELLSPEEQKMIRVITFGSPTLIRNEGFQSVFNMVSVNDGVSSFFLEPFGYIRNFFDPNSNVQFYGSFLNWPYWPADHLLNGSTYGSILYWLGKQFLAEFSPI